MQSGPCLANAGLGHVMLDEKREGKGTRGQRYDINRPFRILELYFSDFPTNQELSGLFARFQTEVKFISSDATLEVSYLLHDSRHSIGRKLRPNVRLDCGPDH